MSAPEISIPVEVLDAAIKAWFGNVPESKDQQEFFRNRMRAALAAAGYTAAPAAGDALDLRKLLARISPVKTDKDTVLGAKSLRNLKSAEDKILAAIAAQQGKGGEA